MPKLQFKSVSRSRHKQIEVRFLYCVVCTCQTKQVKRRIGLKRVWERRLLEFFLEIFFSDIKKPNVFEIRIITFFAVFVYVSIEEGFFVLGCWKVEPRHGVGLALAGKMLDGEISCFEILGDVGHIGASSQVAHLALK